MASITFAQGQAFFRVTRACLDNGFVIVSHDGVSIDDTMSLSALPSCVASSLKIMCGAFIQSISLRDGIYHVCCHRLDNTSKTYKVVSLKSVKAS